MEVEGIRLVIFRTVHIPAEGDSSGSEFWSTGLLIDDQVLFTADTRFDPLLFEQLPMDNVDAIFHDCQLHEPGAVHATYNQLKNARCRVALEDAPHPLRRHIRDVSTRQADGFAGFTQPWAIYQ